MHSGVRKFDAGEFILDQYHQLELIEPVKAEIVTEIRFVCNLFGTNPEIIASKFTCSPARVSIVSPRFLLTHLFGVARLILAPTNALSTAVSIRRNRDFAHSWAWMIC